MSNGIKVLYLDIEAAPAKAYIWDLKTRYVPIQHVAELGYVLCFSYSWGDSDDIYFCSSWEHGEKAMIELAWELLDEADIIVTYNGKSYDIPRLNLEFAKYKLGPPSPYQHVDLYEPVRSEFRVMSRSMNHVLDLFGLETKHQHKGMELWTECMAGDTEAQNQMMEYNIQDVKVMPPLYEVLRPWIKRHPNLAAYMDTEELVCTWCGSDDLKFKSYKYTSLPYKQYHCQNCGAYPRERLRDKTKARSRLVS